MTIEENMALAYLRASTGKAAFLSRISKKEKQKFREHLSLLGMGLEDRMEKSCRTFIGRTKTGTYASYGDNGNAETASS